MAKYKKYNTRQVRRFLKAAFPTSSALIELCQDCYPELLHSFSDGMAHKGMVNAIFNRCHNDRALEKLLDAAQYILEDEGKEDILERYAELFASMDDEPSLSPDELLAQATCAVWREGQVVGTAWLVSNEGELLTAGHLLEEESPVDEVTVRFAGDVPRVAHKIDCFFEQERGIDCAVLKLARPPAQRVPLPISLARSVSGRFRLLGYGTTLDARSTGIGEFVGFHDPEDKPANRLFRLRSAELGVEGYSGGAVFSDALQAVVGIQVSATRARMGAGRDSVLAMPLYRVAQYWEPLGKLAEDGAARLADNRRRKAAQKARSFREESRDRNMRAFRRDPEAYLKRLESLWLENTRS